MLRWRLFSAAILISILLGLVWLDFHQIVFPRPGAWLLPLALLAAALGAGEALELLAAQGHRPVRWPIYGGVLLTVAAAAAPIFVHEYPPACPLGRLGLPLVAMAGAVCAAFCGEMLRYREPGGVIVRVALSVFVVGYVGLLSSFIVLLRLFHDNAWGMVALLSMIVVTKMGDTGAYFTGRLFGRHPMTPHLSPKKTIEGAVGGVAFSVASAWLFLNVVTPRWFVADAPGVEAWRWMTYGALVSIAGMVGDLAESLFKRDMARKDSSTWLPGLGGVLDIVDSLLFAAPVALVCWASGLIGPG